MVDGNGRGVKGISLTLFNASNGQTVSATTNNFGFYGIDGVAVGTFYVLTANESKRFFFANGQRSFTVNGDLSNLDFLAESTR